MICSAWKVTFLNASYSSSMPKRTKASKKQFPTIFSLIRNPRTQTLATAGIPAVANVCVKRLILQL